MTYTPQSPPPTPPISPVEPEMPEIGRRRRRRHDGHHHHRHLRLVITSMSLSVLLLCNFIYYSEALSIHRNSIHQANNGSFGRISAVQSNGMNGGSIRWNKRSRSTAAAATTELALFRRPVNEFNNAVRENTSLQSQWRDNTKSRRRRKMQQLGSLIQKVRSKISLINGNGHNAFDDTTTVNTERARYTSTLGMSSKATPSSFSSTAARLSRIQSFASSPFASTATTTTTTTSRTSYSKPSNTALQMVLSTPDTIIEQASTQKLLDALINESVRTQAGQPIMMQFNPKRLELWRQWRGTVFSETWKSALLNMALATFGVFFFKLYPGLKDMLEGFSILWGQLLSITTFTLTFFLNQSYGLWRKCYDYSRRLQGRLNDLGMTLAAHATRTKPSSPDIPSTYTPQSRQALELISRYVRVFNLLTYASFTRSHRPILTPRGMRRLVERGILTPKEREILSDAEVPATQRHNALLIWIMRMFIEGSQIGVFEGGIGFEQQFMEKCHVIRAQYGAIGDELQGRMPLAYAHIVQVLLDVVLWMYPFMALSTGMAWHISILGTGLLTMFYQGLFDLAKQFLDPYDNENYGMGDDPLVIDTLIAETNAGSVRWMNSFQQQPWNKQLLNDGELYDSILPLWGYSTEDLEEMEAQEEKDRQELENAKKEKKRKQLDQDRQKAEQLLMGHFANVKEGSSMVVEEKWNGTAFLTPDGEFLMRSDVDGVMNANKTFMEVSGGEVVATSSLFPAGSEGLKPKAEVDEAPLNTTAVETEANKVLTLADGTLVTPDDDLTMNTTDSNTTSTESPRDTDKIPAAEDDNTISEEVPPLLDDKDEVAWDSLGAVPNFEESIFNPKLGAAPTYLASLVTNGEAISEVTPSVPLYNTMSADVISDSRLSNRELEDFEWFDEIGEDGQEFRLSQMLADEDWPIEDEEDTSDSANDTPMTYDEFAQKATEIIEQAEEELAETREIMSVSPGSEAEYDVKKRESSLSPVSLPAARRKVLDEPEPLYDQTRLDGISQLWGAPPDVLERGQDFDDDDSEQEILNDGMEFRSVYSLWGEDLPDSFKSVEEEDSVISTPSMDGFSQLWNEDLAPSNGNEREEDDVEPKGEGGNYGAFGLDWWDEVSEDGKELRLSQMLADEEYEETIEPEEEVPMTFEQFAEETEKMIEEAEDERKETEAIMNAPPNANFLEPDEDQEDSAVESSILASDKFEEMVMSIAEDNDVAEEIISDEDIDVLEMDDFEEEVTNETTQSDDFDGAGETLTPEEDTFESVNGETDD